VVEEYYIGWWNLENLFDLENATRTEKLKRTLNKELKGWNSSVLTKKLSQLTKIISQMNSNNGPDILGVCEVESKGVLKKLVTKLQIPKRTYKIVHADTKDKRGIDVAFIYDSKKFTAGKKFSQWIVRRNATRDLFQVNMKVKKTNISLVLIGNHWPSRMGGQYESEPYRIIAGETLSYFHQRIREKKGVNIPIIVMGDFNDEPFNRSITKYALSTNDPKNLKRAKNPKLYNLMWDSIADGHATHYYGSEKTMLDQIMVSKGFLFGNSRLSLKSGSVKVEKIKDMTSKGKPRRFGRPSSKKTYNKNGYSDHFPISVIITKD
jgi:hypothetical protein